MCVAFHVSGHNFASVNFPMQLFSYSGMSLFVDYGWVILNYAGLSAYPDSHVAYQGGAFQIAWYRRLFNFCLLSCVATITVLVLIISCWLLV